MSREWRALLAAQLGWMLDAMDFLLFVFAVPLIQKEFGLSSATMGGLTSVALIASAIGGLAFGAFADRIGRVRAMTISILLYSFATAGLATSNALWQLIAWRVLVGFGMGGEWSCGSVLVAETWPPEHRGKAMGIMQSGWAIGAIFAAGIATPRARAVRLARDVSRRRASGGRRVLHPPRRRRTESVARTKRACPDVDGDLRPGAAPTHRARDDRRQQRTHRVLGPDVVAADVPRVAAE